MKASVFVASSSDDLLAASALAEQLSSFAEVRTWTMDVFTLSEKGLAGLQQFLEAADFAVFIAKIPARKEVRSLPSQFMLQLGFAIASLGPERTIVLLDKEAEVDLPTDLQTIVVTIHHDGPSASRLSTSFSAAIRSIKQKIRKLGTRRVPAELRGPFRDPYVLELLSTPKKSRHRVKSTSRRANSRSTLFISYSHNDARWLTRIQTMLSPLVRSDRMEVWDDTRIKPGTKWRLEIKRAIKSARVALLLVSADFLASRFIMEEELPLLDAARADGLVIVWALISASLFKATPIVDYQAAHPLTKPLDAMTRPKRNQALLSIAETIGEALQTSSNRGKLRAVKSG